MAPSSSGPGASRETGRASPGSRGVFLRAPGAARPAPRARATARPDGLSVCLPCFAPRRSWCSSKLRPNSHTIEDPATRPPRAPVRASRASTPRRPPAALRALGPSTTRPPCPPPERAHARGPPRVARGVSSLVAAERRAGKALGSGGSTRCASIADSAAGLHIRQLLKPPGHLEKFRGALRRPRPGRARRAGRGRGRAFQRRHTRHRACPPGHKEYDARGRRANTKAADDRTRPLHSRGDPRGARLPVRNHDLLFPPRHLLDLTRSSPWPNSCSCVASSRRSCIATACTRFDAECARPSSSTSSFERRASAPAGVHDSVQAEHRAGSGGFRLGAMAEAPPRTSIDETARETPDAARAGRAGTGWGRV